MQFHKACGIITLILSLGKCMPITLSAEGRQVQSEHPEHGLTDAPTQPLATIMATPVIPQKASHKVPAIVSDLAKDKPVSVPTTPVERHKAWEAYYEKVWGPFNAYIECLQTHKGHSWFHPSNHCSILNPKMNKPGKKKKTDGKKES